MDKPKTIVSELRGMMASFNADFSDPVAALQNLVDAISDLPWLTVEHMTAVRKKFHRGEFEGVNPNFAPKPVQLRKMVTTAHFQAIDEIFRAEYPAIAAKPFSERTLEEKRQHTTLKLKAEQSNPFEYLRSIAGKPVRQRIAAPKPEPEMTTEQAAHFEAEFGKLMKKMRETTEKVNLPTRGAPQKYRTLTAADNQGAAE